MRLRFCALAIGLLGCTNDSHQLKRADERDLYPVYEGSDSKPIAGKAGYINGQGRLIIPFQFDSVGDFWEGRARVFVGKRWGFVDEKGKLAIPTRFDDALRFEEGLAPVKTGTRWG